MKNLVKLVVAVVLCWLGMGLLSGMMELAGQTG